MIDQLVTYEVASLAKEKGFDEWCRCSFSPTSKVFQEVSSQNSILPALAAPTQSLLQRWLREEHGWHILIIPVVTMHYTFKIMKVWKKDFRPDLEIETPPYKGVDAYDYSDYEEALEAGLTEAFKLI